MLEFKNSQTHTKIRVWINELPKANYNATNIKSFSLPANTYCDDKKFAIELIYPRNSSNYALLGGQYISDKSRVLKTEIHICDLETYNYNDTIAFESDNVFCGIPKEYANAVSEYMTNNADNLKLPSGKIIFNVGAYGEAGSSKFIFSTATKILFKLLVLDFKNTAPQNIENVIFENQH